MAHSLSCTSCPMSFARVKTRDVYDANAEDFRPCPTTRCSHIAVSERSVTGVTGVSLAWHARSYAAQAYRSAGLSRRELLRASRYVSVTSTHEAPPPCATRAAFAAAGTPRIAWSSRKVKGRGRSAIDCASDGSAAAPAATTSPSVAPGLGPPEGPRDVIDDDLV